jgi:hypothetical protein
MHVASDSGNLGPSPITAIAGCPTAGVLVIGNLHGVVEVLALECGAPESERQVSIVVGAIAVAVSVLISMDGLRLDAAPCACRFVRWTSMC